MNRKYSATLLLSLMVTLVIGAASANAVPLAVKGVTAGDEISSPPPGYMFQDDFETGEASQWTTHGLGTWSVQDNGIDYDYVVNMGSGQNRLGWSTAGDTNWTNYVVEFNIMGVSGSPNLLFGVRYSDLEYSGYTFGLRTDLDQAYLIDDTNYPSYIILQQVPYQSSFQTWYHMLIKVDGPHLQLFINNQEVINYTLGVPYRTHGKIALTGWTGAYGSHEVRFDNVIVYYPYNYYLPIICNYLLP